MIITPEKYFKKILELSKSDVSIKPYVQRYILKGEIDNDALVILYKNNKLDDIKTISFYKHLIKKIHKLYTELLKDEPKTACECIKTITSLITQSTITLEKQFNNDVESANEFMDCVGLKDLSKALFTYFNSGDISKIEKELFRVKEDLILVKDNFTEEV